MAFCRLIPWGSARLRPPSSSSSCSLVLWLTCILILATGVRAQRGKNVSITEPSEVEALNSIFSHWMISSAMSFIKWNISDNNPCTGAAVNNSINIDDKKFNPAIKCNCSPNFSTCHIVELKIADFKTVDGLIPQGIQNLTRLSTLKLQGNYLSGPIPTYIGNMISLKNLNVSSNMLTGVIPRELGKLQNLISLDLSMNNFSGSLPEELGNLTALQQMSLSSLGLGIIGSIPYTFSQLKRLHTLSISDNNYTGRLPDFIGSFIELEDLRVQGNSFDGPIPPSFSKLTNLTQLRIGEILSGSSNLAFIQNMTSLVTLVLRNNNMSGSIPSNVESYTKLEHLDLTFNNLAGRLPESLFNHSSLKYLFLGNNSLSGNLPLTRSKNIIYIDVSYNNLSGRIPSWIADEGLQTNLVANNFIIDSSEKRPFLLRLRCLQKSFPCHDSANQSSFAINCGGSQIVVASNKLDYVIDGKNLTAASYFVDESENWAVSTVGRFIGVDNPLYVQSITSRFANTQYNELFQSARLSPSSLRYYGLRLINERYTVKLQFAETDDWDKRKGRRLFDIFIQGRRVAQNFDITKEAGGSTLFAVQKNYTAHVTNNILEIHFFWSGKGTCCVPMNGFYGPSISAISVTPDFEPVMKTIFKKKSRTLPLIVGVCAGCLVLCGILISVMFIWRQRKRRLEMEEDEDLRDLTVRPHTFSYAELRSATEDFILDNKLGEGGSGVVYKGTLHDGRSVAVKQLFISSVQGKKRLLVFEYLTNGSLDQVLFDKKINLDWPTRYEICVETARGLVYLHEESNPRIIHRDVKASNILLDSNFLPKISDFGLAKLYDKDKSHITTGVAGTVGYLAPEYAMRGQLTEKADVFAFGVVVLEILCGRRNTEPELGEEKIYLLEWAWHLHEDNHDLEMIDTALTSYNESEALRLIKIAFMCTQASPTKRPTMSRVVAMLVGDMEVTDILSKPSYLMGWWASDKTADSLAPVSDQSSRGWAQPPLGRMNTVEEGR